MRCDSAFASIYDEAGEEIENAEMLFMDQGAYIYRAYSNGHPYDTAQVLNLLNHLSNSISTKTEGLRVDRLGGLVSSLYLKVQVSYSHGGRTKYTLSVALSFNPYLKLVFYKSKLV